MLECWLSLLGEYVLRMDWVGTMTAVVNTWQSAVICCFCIVRPDAAIAIAVAAAAAASSGTAQTFLARSQTDLAWRGSQRTIRGVMMSHGNNGRRRLLKIPLCVCTQRQGAGGNVSPHGW